MKNPDKWAPVSGTQRPEKTYEQRVTEAKKRMETARDMIAKAKTRSERREAMRRFNMATRP